MSTDGSPLSYMDLPGVYIRNSVEEIDGEQFDDITDWGDTFIVQTRKALSKLLAGKKGRGKILLEAISKFLTEKKKKITIEPAGEFGGQGGSGWDAKDSIVRWCAASQNDPTDWDQLHNIPSFIILGHELIHVLHTLNESAKYGYDEKTDTAIEEARTVGLGPWRDDALTENGLRDEWDLKKRTTFQGVTADKILKGTKFAGL